MNRIILLWLLVLTACSGENCYNTYPDYNNEIFTAKAGNFKVTPLLWHEESNVQPNGKYYLRLLEGFDNYSLEPYSENHDWMKLAGVSLCRFCPSDENNIMLGVRYLPNKDETGDIPDVNIGSTQISFYLNIDGIRYDRWSPVFHDDYPIVEVEQDSLIIFWWDTTPYSVTMGIEYGDSTYIAVQSHPGVKRYQRPISGWMGGTTRPNTRKIFERIRICN